MSQKCAAAFRVKGVNHTKLNMPVQMAGKSVTQNKSLDNPTKTRKIGKWWPAVATDVAVKKTSVCKTAISHAGT